MKILSGSANKPFAEKIAKTIYSHFGSTYNLCAMDLSHFSDGEIRVEIKENIRGKDVFIIQSMSSPVNDHLMEMLVMIDAAKRASASRVTAVIPFYAYARQDRKDKPRVPITAKLVANLIVAAGADRVLSMDFHAPQIQGFFDIPVDHLHATPIFLDYINQNFSGENMVVVAPDTGSAKTADYYSGVLKCGFAIVAKQRKGENVEAKALVGDVRDKVAFMIDDLSTTAGTLCAASELISEGGAKAIYAAVTHNLLTDKGLACLENSAISKIIVTDTVPTIPNGLLSNGKMDVVSVADLFAKAIWRIHKNESVSSLFVH